MRMRTFNAPDMPRAMQMVREELGENAIILSSKERMNGTRYISVTAACEEDDLVFHTDTLPQQSFTPSPAPAPSTDLHAIRHDLRETLRFHNLPELFIAKMLQALEDEVLLRIAQLQKISQSNSTAELTQLAMEHVTNHLLEFEPLDTRGKPARIMLVGAPGIGKTLTIAKLASRLAMEEIPVVVITTDNKRAGGIEQLKAFTDILGLDLKTADSPAALAKLLATLPNFAHILIDTAGCNPYKEEEIRLLQAYSRMPGMETILVMPAGGDSLEAIDMIENFIRLPIKRLLVTHADATRRFGSVLATALAGKLAMCNISHSSSVVDSVQPANSKLLASMLLRYQLQSG